MTKIFGLILRKEPKNAFLKNSSKFRASEIHEVISNSLFKILLQIFAAVEIKYSRGTDISCGTRSPVFHLTINKNLETGICKSQNLALSHAMTATIRQQRNEVTELSFAALDKEITNSTPTNQVLLLSQLVKKKHGPTKVPGSSSWQSWEESGVFAKLAFACGPLFGRK